MSKRSRWIPVILGLDAAGQTSDYMRHGRKSWGKSASCLGSGQMVGSC